MKNQKIFSMNHVFNVLILLCFTFAFTFFIHTSARAASAPDNLKQTDAYENTVTVSWSDSDSYPNSFCYYINSSSEFKCSNTDAIDIQNYSYTTIGNLQPGNTYYVWIGFKQDNTTILWSAPLKVVTRPERIAETSIINTNATDSTFSLSWDPVPGATSYEVFFYENDVDGNLYGNEVEVNSHSATILGLKQGTGYHVAVASLRTEGSYVAKSWLKYYDGSMFTLPAKVTGVKCDCSFQGCASLNWDKNEKATSYQYEIFKYDGKTKIASGTTVNSNHKTVYNSKLQQNQFYKVHIRAVKGTYTNKCLYGAWSTYNYFASCNRGDISMKKVNNKIKIYWNKVTGATDYTIYMSDKESSGYEKLLTTKKTSLLINKKVKNGKYYYIRIVPNYKVGEKIYTAPINDKTFYSVCIHTAKRGWEIY